MYDVRILHKEGSLWCVSHNLEMNVRRVYSVTVHDLCSTQHRTLSARPSTSQDVSETSGVQEVEAIYDYDAIQSGDLPFRKGDRIKILKECT